VFQERKKEKFQGKLLDSAHSQSEYVIKSERINCSGSDRDPSPPTSPPLGAATEDRLRLPYQQ